MGNLAINQLPNAANSTDDDYYYIVRSGVDYKIKRSNMPPAILTAQVTIAAADVLTLFTTPVLAIPAAPAGQVIVAMRGLVEFANGGVDYATNTALVLAPTSNVLEVVLAGSIADRLTANALTVAAAVVPSGMVAGDSMSLTVATGNPATGDSDLTITVWYYLLSIP
jgi:hypothetical protein